VHKLMLYALSTCVWCKRSRRFLDDNGIAYDYIYVDLLDGAKRNEVMAIVRQWNPRESFPTLIIDDAQAIVGFDESKWREVLLT
jgi:glutaredoxin-like protein NrdH